MPRLLEATRRVRETHFGKRVKVCVLLNAQSGICPEDCNYCSQSKISTAEVEKYKLLPEDEIVARAEQAAANARAAALTLGADTLERLASASEPVKRALGNNPDLWQSGDSSRYR